MPLPAPPLPKRNLKWRLIAAGVFVAALAFGGWGLWRLLSPAGGDVRVQLADSERGNRALQSELEQLRQRVSTLTRSDQISRDANTDLQNTLAERDEEISALRADVAFYERLVGATGQRRGLAVHALRMQPQDNGVWHFTATLTQNLNRGAVSVGQLSLALEGSRGGRLQRLGWGELRQQPDAAGVGYSFKYFQQVEGDVFLPAGLTPARVTVRLAPRGGSAVEQSFTWADVTRAADAPATAGAAR